jgi:hypothetical protein
MLSKSFERRINQNIAIDFKDVPINPAYISQVKSVTGLPLWRNQMDECGSYSRDSNLINSLKGSAFDKVDFANKTLNQAGKTAKVLSKKNKEDQED